MLAGAAAGLALAFKYTAGLVLLPLGIAALARLRADGPRVLAAAAGGAGLAALVFLALNPYLLGSLRQLLERPARAGRGGGRRAEAGPAVGRRGLLPREPDLGARLAGGAGGAGGRRARAAPRPDPRPAAGRACRWPCSPTSRCSRATSAAGCCRPTRCWRCWPRWRWHACRLLAPERRDLPSRVALAALTLLVLAQPLAADVRSALGARARRHARAAARLPRAGVRSRAARVGGAGGARPLVSQQPRAGGCPPGWAAAQGPRLAAARRRAVAAPRLVLSGPGGRRVCARFRPGQFARPDGGVRASAYHAGAGAGGDRRPAASTATATSSPSTRVRERTRRAGRARSTPTTGAWSARPTSSGASAPTTRAPSRSRSTSTSPSTTTRAPTTGPGPVATVYRLRDCRQAYGAPVIQIPRARELEPFAPRKGDAAGDEPAELIRCTCRRRAELARRVALEVAVRVPRGGAASRWRACANISARSARRCRSAAGRRCRSRPSSRGADVHVGVDLVRARGGGGGRRAEAALSAGGTRR